jgi:hypothetical protein
MKNKLLDLVIFLGSVAISHAQNGLHFDGVNDVVNCGNHSSLSFSTNTITVEAWINPTSWKTNIFEGSIVVKEQNTSNNGFMFRAGNQGRLNFAIGANGLPWVELTTANPVLSLNVWQHVAATYNGTRMRLFVNGVKVDSLNYTGQIGNANNPMTIGGWYTTGRNWSGRIDEVRVWNIARTPAQIMATMNDEFCGVVPGMVAYYRFNQGVAGGTNTSVLTATDVTGNNNGTLQNFALAGSTSNWVAGAPVAAGMSGSGSLTATVCDSYTSPTGKVWTTNGTYVDTITSPGGCDSIVTYNLTFKSSSAGSANVLACNKYVSPSGKYTWTATGTYKDTITNSVGCDSVLTITLFINNVNINVLQNGIVLTSWETGATYKWLDCLNGKVPVPGATSQTFIPAANGSYAVAVTKAGCTDTSACYTVTGIGVEEDLMAGKVVVYPNPVRDYLVVRLPEGISIAQMKILSISGQVLVNQGIENHTQWPVSLPSGVYFLEISTTSFSTVQRIVIE